MLMVKREKTAKQQQLQQKTSVTSIKMLVVKREKQQTNNSCNKKTSVTSIKNAYGEA